MIYSLEGSFSTVLHTRTHTHTLFLNIAASRLTIPHVEIKTTRILLMASFENVSGLLLLLVTVVIGEASLSLLKFWLEAACPV